MQQYLIGYAVGLSLVFGAFTPTPASAAHRAASHSARAPAVYCWYHGQGHCKNDPYWEPCYVSHYGGRNTCN
jgi:hypothetical protein